MGVRVHRRVNRVVSGVPFRVDVNMTGGAKRFCNTKALHQWAAPMGYSGVNCAVLAVCWHVSSRRMHLLVG
jgi:hypothetical protein